MPYDSNLDLPNSVQRHLPLHAQNIYREAFNRAWVRYDYDQGRAYRIAWGAVKRDYGKTPGGRWVRITRGAA